MTSVDYFNGRSVEAVEKDDNGWVIVLEAGGRIYTNDGTDPVEEIVGMSLNVCVLGAYDDTDERNPVTELYFGTPATPRATVVHLRPTQYAISDDNFTDGKVVKPQAGGRDLAEPDLAEGES